MSVRTASAQIIESGRHCRGDVFSYTEGYALRGAVRGQPQSNKVLDELSAEVGQDDEAWEQEDPTDQLLAFLRAGVEQLRLA